jgi:transposase
MPRSHPPYPLEFRAKAARLVRSGERTPEQLLRDLGCAAQAIRNRVRKPGLDAGRRTNGPTTAEREELSRLRRSATSAPSSTNGGISPAYPTQARICPQKRGHSTRRGSLRWKASQACRYRRDAGRWYCPIAPLLLHKGGTLTSHDASL